MLWRLILVFKVFFVSLATQHTTTSPSERQKCIRVAELKPCFYKQSCIEYNADGNREDDGSIVLMHWKAVLPAYIVTDCQCCYHSNPCR